MRPAIVVDTLNHGAPSLTSVVFIDPMEKKMPRRPHNPSDNTRAEVRALQSFGVPQEEIATYIGVDVNTLRNHYQYELDTAKTKANAAVAKFLYQNASGQSLKSGASHADCVRAAIFWAKTRMQWAETNNTDTTSTTGPSRVVAMNAKSKQNPKR